VSEALLGIKPQFDGLLIEPCIPIGTYYIRRRFRDAEYDLTIHYTGKKGGQFIPYRPGRQVLEIEL
jgi:cellobiose phosphorylase